MSVQVASWNIHRCFGTDGIYSPERVLDVAIALDADILGLQEVDMRLLVDGRTQLDFFAQSLFMHAIAGPNLKGRRGKFGNALLSRWPVRQFKLLDLSVRHFEPRGAIIARLDVGFDLRVVVTHLGLNMAERRLQVRVLAKALAEETAETTIVMGDFNEWRPGLRALRPLDNLFGPSRTARTFPSRMPILPLDRLWISPASPVVSVQSYVTALSRVASDHLPLWAKLNWQADAHLIRKGC